MTKGSTSEKSLGTFLRDIAIIVVLALLISFVIKTWLMRAFYIPSESMEDTLLVNDRILVNQLAGPVMDIERGDVVVFDDPGGWLGPGMAAGEDEGFNFLEFVGLVPADAGNQLIKRVIGLPGDTVTCCDAEGRISVNGEPIDETYLADGVAPSDMPFEVTVPPGTYWVMGDNRPNSADSRYNMEAEGGPFVSEDDLVGRAFVINWPLDRIEWLSNPDAVFADVPAP